jgi:hypothetical protein
LGRYAQAVKQGAMKVMLWRPKRGGGVDVPAAIDDDDDVLGDLNDSTDVDIRGLLLDILTITRDNLDENDETFRSTTNIRLPLKSSPRRTSECFTDLRSHALSQAARL